MHEDEIVMYLIINKDLHMPVGKTSAMVGHAVHYLMNKRDEMLATLDWGRDQGQNNYVQMMERAATFNKWHISSAHPKIVLGASTKDFNKIKTELKDQVVVVVDAGRTVVDPGTETCLGLLPVVKSLAPKIIKRCQLL
jgi:peptidyl-tRNA hydrolase